MRAVILSTLFVGVAFATEAIYLANGDNVYQNCGQSDPPESTIAYYNNIDDSQNQQYPDDIAYVSSCGDICWECGTVQGTFSSGTTFTVNINSDAGGYAVGQYAGYGYNSYGTGFDCFRDNDRRLYGNRGGSFNSIYYCKQT